VAQNIEFMLGRGVLRPLILTDTVEQRHALIQLQHLEVSAVRAANDARASRASTCRSRSSVQRCVSLGVLRHVDSKIGKGYTLAHENAEVRRARGVARTWDQRLQY
jgi:hypothetical protein